MQPDIALAIEDFLPVILTFLALVWLSQTVGHLSPGSQKIAYLGSFLVLGGGLLKAVEKLNWAISGQNIPWMSSALFVLMAPGFALLAWSVWIAQKRPASEAQSLIGEWRVPGTMIAIIWGGTALAQLNNKNQGWFFILLGIVVVASSVLALLLSRLAGQLGAKRLSALFIVYLVSILVLNGLARVPSETNAAEWIKQLSNTAAAMLFAYGCWRLWARTVKATKV